MSAQADSAQGVLQGYDKAAAATAGSGLAASMHFETAPFA
jgi:hypothetical protein